ncbi:MAG: hypothetical protein V1703_03605 [Candidatus Altiarchaeota archaeon]
MQKRKPANEGLVGLPGLNFDPTAGEHGPSRTQGGNPRDGIPAYDRRPPLNFDVSKELVREMEIPLIDALDAEVGIARKRRRFVEGLPLMRTPEELTPILNRIFTPSVRSNFGIERGMFGRPETMAFISELEDVYRHRLYDVNKGEKGSRMENPFYFYEEKVMCDPTGMREVKRAHTLLLLDKYR